MTQDVKEILVSEQELSGIFDRIAAQIDEDYRNSERITVLVCILKGSLMFTCELMKRITVPTEVEFMKVSSYASGTISSGEISLQLDLNRDDLNNVNLIIIEDIIDSGRTLSHLVEHLRRKGADSIRICTLFDKPDRRVTELVPDYCGKIIPDEFIVGFGLDYNEQYRNLPFVGVLKKEIYSGNTAKQQSEDLNEKKQR